MQMFTLCLLAVAIGIALLVHAVSRGRRRQAFTVNPDILKLKDILEPGWAPRLLGLLVSGVPTALNGADTLKEELRTINTQISTDKAEATSKWQVFETARNALAETGKVADTDSPEFKAAEAASGEYEQVAERIRVANEQHQSISRLLFGSDAPDANNGPEDGGPVTIAQALGGRAMSAAQMAIQSDAYQEMRDRNAFAVSGRKSIDGVLVRSAGDEPGGSWEGRNALKAALASGHPLFAGHPSAALVTGTSRTSGGALVFPDVLPGIQVPLLTRPLRLVDMITVGQTDSDTVEFVQMTGFTNNAAETAEATASSGTSGTKPESGLALLQVSEAVRTLAHWIPATKRSLADAGQLQTLIESILQLGLDLRLDQQIATGDGQGENLRGVRNTPGIGQVTQTVPVASGSAKPESLLDTIHRAITVCRLSFYEPTAIGIHPSDWERARLKRSLAPAVANSGSAGSEATGDYLLGDPSQAGAARLWGLLPVVSAAFPVGFPLIGDYRQVVLWLRQGVQVLASDSHQDFFIRNLVALLAEFRAALGVLAPPAFCEADISASI